MPFQFQARELTGLERRDHAECSLYVRTLVVMLKELFTVEVVEVEHACPEF